jgi:pimeloyl-ACP methyl ester carboxylesterase
VTAIPPPATRRELLATMAAAGAVSLLPPTMSVAAEDGSIRPFRADIPQDAFIELRRRVMATRWPDRDNTGTSSTRSYWDAAQGGGGPFIALEIITVPVAVRIFPGEIYRAPRSWAEQSFHKLIYWNEVSKGGHFAAWEEPEVFAAGDARRIPTAAPGLLKHVERRAHRAGRLSTRLNY